MKRPESIHFHKPTAQTMQLTLLLVSIAVLILFAYLSYLAYAFLTDTQFYLSGYLLIGPVFVAVILLTTLVVAGKVAFYKELGALRKYKHKISFH